jgi:hypothetical protein
VTRSWENHFIRADPDRHSQAVVVEAERQAILGIVSTNPEMLSRESASLIMQRLSAKLLHQTERSAKLARGERLPVQRCAVMLVESDEGKAPILAVGGGMLNYIDPKTNKLGQTLCGSLG